MTNTPQPTNEESTRQLTAKANKALLAEISKDWKAVEEAAARIKSRTIFAVNKLRAVGLKLQQLSGHEQISLDFYMKVHAELPKSLHYTAAKCAVHVANRIAQPVETVQEAMMVQRDLFAAMNEYKEPKRIEAQTAHERNPISDFVSWGSTFTRLFSEYNPAPATKWRRDEKETFLRTVEPIVEKYQEVKATL